MLEGTINVPEKSVNDVMMFVCSDVFSRALVYLADPDISDEYYGSEQAINKLIAKYKRIYGDFELFNDLPTDGSGGISGTCYINMADVDQRYFKQNQSKSKRTYKIAVLSHAHEHRTSGGAYFQMNDSGRGAKITINTPVQDRLVRAVNSPELFEGMLKKIHGTVHHELMHAIQDMALNQMNGNIDYYNKSGDGTLDDDKYYTHPIEFSPQITSSVHDYLGFLDEIENMGRSLTPADKKQLMLSFVQPGTISPYGNNTLLPFFETLYKKDKAKWKKAVKYFYDLVQRKSKEQPQ